MTQVRQRVEEHEPRLRRFVDVTPVTALALPGGGDVLVKCEHLQRTGSFKIRGALAKLLTLTQQQRVAGVVTASSGNHGLGVAYALTQLGGNGVVFVPENASAAKVAAIESLGMHVRREGIEAGAAEIRARAFAKSEGLVYVSPYNDIDVIAGQGSIGVEIDRQVPAGRLDTVVVAVGGGGLAAGVAAAIKARRPNVRVIGASPTNDAAMYASVQAGRVIGVDALPTLSDGTAGALEPGSVTLPLCTRLVDEWVLVDEDRIGTTVQTFAESMHQVVEGAAAVAVSAAMTVAEADPDGRTLVVACGSNIDPNRLHELRRR